MNSESKTTHGFSIDASGIEAFVFDFDGTLVDSEPVWKSTFFDVFKELYAIELSEEILWENTGNGVDLSVTNISTKYKLSMTVDEINGVALLLHKKVEELILETLELRNGGHELLEWATTKDISLGICTASTPELINQYLEKHDLAKHFSGLVSTATSALDKRKPYPYPYLKSMEILGTNPESTIAIEDSPAGVKSARSAGITTIAIHNPYLEKLVEECDPICQVSDFAQVLELFSS